jgi:hypothetical protein
MRRALSIALVAMVCVSAPGAAREGRAATGGGGACPVPRSDPAYVARVLDALRSGRDVWGEALLAAPRGPTFAAARRYLRPLLLARGPDGKSLTDSGVYYLPFAQPGGPRGAGSVALHVADGSQIVSERVGGRSLTVFVDGERYGSCLARIRELRLAEGWLPILETEYADAEGVRYRQESFAARSGPRSPLASYVRLTIDTRRARRAAVVTLVPSARGEGVAYRVPAGRVRTVYSAWIDRPLRPLAKRDAREFAAARRAVERYWRQRLAGGMTVSVPEARVENAWRALLVQELVLTWRYSIGNAYEEFSFPEGVDVAQVMSELGFGNVARAILRTSLTRKPTPYPNWKKGERLLASAEYFHLAGDRDYIEQSTRVLTGFVSALGRQIDTGGGLLRRERYSSDVAESVYGLHSQAVVWAGLRAMGEVWSQTGHPNLAATCRRLAARLGGALRRAVDHSERKLADGSLFVPARLLDGERPYDSLTESRLGSYWNLVVPYALAMGFFPAGGSQSRGILRYLELHGSRLLGLVRAGAYALYGRQAPAPVSGTDEVYGINVARFLANEHQSDQLVLSLYGDLAAGMTASTYVSGEAASVAPLAGASYRAMYLPPNGAANAAFLETLRVMLVHETPDSLELAYSTPRAWLSAGKQISVQAAPTSFGQVSYALRAHTGAVRAEIRIPPGARRIVLRLRLPAGKRIASVTAGGKPFGRVNRVGGTIDLTGRSGTVRLVARLSRAARTS